MNSNPVITHVCTYPGTGGAGIAALRLVKALAGHLPTIEIVGIPTASAGLHPLVKNPAYGRSPQEALWRRFRAWQCRHDQAIIQRSDAALTGFFTDRSAHGWSLGMCLKQSNLIHLHWVNDLIDYSFVLRRIPSSTPVVWTLHDMSAFTGGCCYDLGCQRFQDGCGCCPQLASEHSSDLSSQSLARRDRALQSILNRLHLVAPSNWMARMAASSRLMAGVPCRVIPNAVDLNSFHPRHRDAGRRQLGLDSGTAMLLFVAASVNNPVKGMATLVASLPQVMNSCQIQLEIACIGEQSDLSIHGVRTLGSVKDPNQLAEIYAAADLLVVPSLIDNFPNVIAEAHASGLPVIASAVGGIPEMVKRDVTGELVPPGDAKALGAAITTMLPKVITGRLVWSARCRAAAEERYAPERVAEEHLNLYKQALRTRSSFHSTAVS